VSFKESETLVSSVVLQADPSATTAPGEDCEKELETSALGPLAKLPPFRPVVITLLRLFDQPEVTIADVTRLVESDPAIISEILAIVNSPLFGFQGAVATAPHAISLLGLDRTRSLVSVLAMRAMMANSPRTPVVRRVWTHSVATGAIAQHLAPYFGVNKDFAHVAGIMHDLGRMGLLAAYTSSYTEIALSAQSFSMSIMGPPQCGQSQPAAGFAAILTGVSARACGLPPSSCLQRGSICCRRRFARKPEKRIRTNPRGKTWSMKRRRNSSAVTVILRCLLP
jgi:hypothetical protein